jgi:hypothetical protein
MCNQAYKDLLVSYLYDDLNDMDRAKVEMHLRACESCREELSALRGVRGDLAQWTPVLPDLGFRIVRELKPASRPSWRAWWTPAAGLAAAATLVLAAALSLAHIEIHNGPDGLTVRTGWVASAPSISTAGIGGIHARPVDVFIPNDTVNPAGLAGIAQRIDALEMAMKQTHVQNASALSDRAADEALVKRVRDMLAQSESRQQNELVLRIAQVIRDVNNQRLADQATIQTGFARVESNMTKEAAAHMELVNYVTNTAPAGKQK